MCVGVSHGRSHTVLFLCFAHCHTSCELNSASLLHSTPHVPVAEVCWAARGPTHRTWAGGARWPGQLADACQSSGGVVVPSFTSPGPLVSSSAFLPVRRDGPRGPCPLRAAFPSPADPCMFLVRSGPTFFSDFYLFVFSSWYHLCFYFNVVQFVSLVRRKPLSPQGFKDVFCLP